MTNQKLFEHLRKLEANGVKLDKNRVKQAPDLLEFYKGLIIHGTIEKTTVNGMDIVTIRKPQK